MVEIIASITTLMVMVTFLVIVVWAWGSQRKADFDEAANLVFDEQIPEANLSTRKGEK